MFLDNLDYFHIAMRMYTVAYKPKSQVNHSWSQRQNCFLPNIFTKYFLGGVYHRCPVREKRFTKFSRVVYDGQIYMTSQDFLEAEQVDRR